MKKEILNELGKAGYEARCTEMAKGIYQDSVTRLPTSNLFIHWDELTDSEKLSPDAVSAVKTLYRKQGEAAVQAFFAYILTNGTQEAKNTLHTLLHEIETLVMTDQERARDYE